MIYYLQVNELTPAVLESTCALTPKFTVGIVNALFIPYSIGFLLLAFSIRFVVSRRIS